MQSYDQETTDCCPVEMFVGNLRRDLDQHLIVEKLRGLFTTVGVNTNTEDFSVPKRGSKKAKHLFVTLESRKNLDKLIKYFDGLKDSDFIANDKSLKITEKKEKKSKAKNSNKKKASFPVKNHPQQPLTATDPKLKQNKSAPIISSSLINDSGNHIKESENSLWLYTGQILRNEDRKTEYKRGSGNYLKNILSDHVRKYVCAFLNSEGGRLLIGVADDGQVYGLECLRQQEDKIRIQIDSIISRFQPPVLPAMYAVNFIPVIPHNNDCMVNNYDDQGLKVLQIRIHPIAIKKTLFETDKGEVYVRRDGSVQGPLKASQIIDWCRFNEILGKIDSENLKETAMGEAVNSQKHKSDPGGTPYVEVHSSKQDDWRTAESQSLSRINELEREIYAIKRNYEEREKMLQEELEKSRLELRRQGRPKSAACSIL